MHLGMPLSRDRSSEWEESVLHAAWEVAKYSSSSWDFIRHSRDRMKQKGKLGAWFQKHCTPSQPISRSLPLGWQRFLVPTEFLQGQELLPHPGTSVSFFPLRGRSKKRVC